MCDRQSLVTCRDLGGWSGEQAAAFWRTFEERPDSGIKQKPPDEEGATTVAQPSLPGRAKTG